MNTSAPAARPETAPPIKAVIQWMFNGLAGIAVRTPYTRLEKTGTGWRIGSEKPNEANSSEVTNVQMTALLRGSGSEICRVVPNPRSGRLQRLLRLKHTPVSHYLICSVAEELREEERISTVRVAAHLPLAMRIRRGSMLMLERDREQNRDDARLTRFGRVEQVNVRKHETTLEMHWSRQMDEDEEKATERPLPRPRTGNT